MLLDDGTGKLLKESNLRLALDEEDAEDEDAGASLTLRGVPGSTKSEVTMIQMRNRNHPTMKSTKDGPNKVHV